METTDQSTALPPALFARVQTVAAEERRPIGEIVREAVERYLESRQAGDGTAPVSAAIAERGMAAAAQIGELRKGNILPEGMTIADLITEGRA